MEPSPPVPTAVGPAPVEPAEPVPGTAAPDRRGRAVVLLAGLATALVMGGLVALALGGGGAEAPPAPVGAGSLPGAGSPPLPPGCAAVPEAPPRLVLDLPESGVDFGRVKQGASIEREVPFRNAGTGVLCLVQQGTPCGCVKLTYKDPAKTRYEPGEAGAVVLTLHTEGHQGVQSKNFWIYTNELENPRHTWPVKADISQGVIVSAGHFAFGRHRRGERATATLRLTSPKADAEWTVTDVVVGKVGSQEPPAMPFEVKLVEDPNLRVVEVTVTHPGREVEGPWSAPVTIRTSHPDRPEIPVMAYLDVVAPLMASHPVGVFGFVQAGVPKELTIRVTATTPGTTFRLLEALVEGPGGAAPGPEGPGFTATLLADAKDGPQVRVAYDGKGRKPGQLEATLVLRTDLPEQKELRIPLRATVPEKPRGAPPEPPAGR